MQEAPVGSIAAAVTPAACTALEVCMLRMQRIATQRTLRKCPIAITTIRTRFACDFLERSRRHQVSLTCRSNAPAELDQCADNTSAPHKTTSAILGRRVWHDDTDAYQSSAGERTERNSGGVEVVLDCVHLGLDGVLAVAIWVPGRRAPVAAPRVELGALLVVEHVDAFPTVDLDDAREFSPGPTFGIRLRAPPPQPGTRTPCRAACGPLSRPGRVTIESTDTEGSGDGAETAQSGAGHTVVGRERSSR